MTTMFVVPPPDSSSPPADPHEAFAAMLTLIVIAFLVYGLGKIKLPSFKRLFVYAFFLLRKKEDMPPQQTEKGLAHTLGKH